VDPRDRDPGRVPGARADPEAGAVSELATRYRKVGRILGRAELRARRRFRAMIDERTYADAEASATRRYVEAERLIDRLGEPEAILGRRKA
jgi:hypothetical protein